MQIKLNKVNHLLIAGWALILFFPFLGSTHLFDWDEVNFAESAREMLLTKEYFRVQINFKPFWEKPPLFFWLQSLSFAAFGVTEFAARFPNALVGLLVLVTLFHIASKHFNQTIALLWVLFTTASFTPHLYYKSGIIDPWFNYFIFLSIYQLFLVITKPNNNKHFVYMGIFCGLAVLTKGPVALLVLGLCGAVWFVIKRGKPYFKWYQPIITLFITTCITSVWFMSELLKNGSSVLTDFLAYQVDLFLNPVAGHGQPWYYHSVVILLGCFPASFFFIGGLVYQSKNDSDKQVILKQIMLVLFWVVLVLFSIVKTKIVHYSSLCYLPLTFIAAHYTESVIAEKTTIPKWLSVMMGLIGCILISGIIAVTSIEAFKPYLLPYLNDDFLVAALSVKGIWNGAEWNIGVVYLIVLIIFFIQFFRQNITSAIFLLLVVYSLLLPILLWQVAPKIERYSQEPAIKFYQSLVDKDVYVESVDFKSYAQYFYAKQRNHGNANAYNTNWLISGPIDKDAYFVAKITSANKCEQMGLTEIGREGGFVFYYRKSTLK